MDNFNLAYEKEKDEQLPFFTWLSCDTGIGIQTYRKIQRVFGSPKEFFYASDKSLEASGIFGAKALARLYAARRNSNPLRVFDNMLKSGIEYVSYEAKEYPWRLKNTQGCPIGLFVKGNLPEKMETAVSVIGARACSDYGEMVARELGSALGRYKVPLISGMARGVDSLSQIAAVSQGGPSFAVLGGGVDIVYPKESYKLYEYLCKEGGVISEYPPGTAPQKVFFAERNRIISGMSDVVCVVEAREKSGTMITVDCALEQGREVFAVPGRITDCTSKGCNELIRQGAGILTDIEDFVKNYISTYNASFSMTINIEETVLDPEKEAACIPKEAKSILEVINENSFLPDEIQGKTTLSSYEVMTECMKLAMDGYLTNCGGGRFKISQKGMEFKNKFFINDLR